MLVGGLELRTLTVRFLSLGFYSLFIDFVSRYIRKTKTLILYCVIYGAKNCFYVLIAKLVKITILI